MFKGRFGGALPRVLLSLTSLFSKSPLLRPFAPKLYGFCMLLAFVELAIKPRALLFSASMLTQSYLPSPLLPLWYFFIPQFCTTFPLPHTSFFLVSSKYPGRPRAIGSPGCSPASCLCKLSSIHPSIFLFNSTAVYGSPVLILQQRQQSKDGLLWSVLSSHHVGPSD